MDVLEAIVICDKFAVDGSSREYFAWPDLDSLSESKGNFYEDSDFLYSLGEEVSDHILAASAEKVDRFLRSGKLAGELGFLPTKTETAVLPQLYQDPDQFVELTSSNFADEVLPRYPGIVRLRKLGSDLQSYSDPIRNFAFFAFRGFYYQELAHLLSTSYMPHSWRSGIIGSQIEHPVVNFSDVVADTTEKVRAELASKLNGEFASPALTTDFPMLASYIIAQASSRAELLRVAVEIRNTPKASAFRHWVNEVQRKLRDQRDLVRIARANEELHEVVQQLERELKLVKRRGRADLTGKQDLKIKLGVPLAVAGVPLAASVEFGSPVSLGMPAWVSRVLQRRTHLVFLRDLTRQSLALAPFALAY
jgi:hypothetical protein